MSFHFIFYTNITFLLNATVQKKSRFLSALFYVNQVSVFYIAATIFPAAAQAAAVAGDAR